MEFYLNCDGIHGINAIIQSDICIRDMMKDDGIIQMQYIEMSYGCNGQMEQKEIYEYIGHNGDIDIIE